VGIGQFFSCNHSSKLVSILKEVENQLSAAKQKEIELTMIHNSSQKANQEIKEGNMDRMTWLMSDLGRTSQPELRVSMTSEFEEKDRRTDIDDFINSLRESTSDGDVIAFQKLPDDIDSSLI